MQEEYSTDNKEANGIKAAESHSLAIYMDNNNYNNIQEM